MSQEVKNLKKLGQYFNKRVDESNNSLYANGISSEKNGTTVNKIYDEIFLEIIDILNLLSGEQVLDVGCGTGEILYRLNKITEGAQGIDISEEMVNLASQKKLNVKLFDGLTFPFDKGSFDIVIIYQVFINLSPNIARNLLREAARVVKPGGKIFIGAIPHPAKSGLSTHALNWRIYLKKALRIKQPIHYFSYEYSFFTEEFDRLAFQQVSFFPCSAQCTKFHVLFNS